MSSNIADLSDQVGPIRQLSDNEKNAARRFAAEHAKNESDLQLLLEAMGLGGAA